MVKTELKKAVAVILCLLVGAVTIGGILPAVEKFQYAEPIVFIVTAALWFVIWKKLVPKKQKQKQEIVYQSDPEMEKYEAEERKRSGIRMPDLGRSLHPIPDKCVIFDLETTGLDGLKDQIIEIAAVKIEHGLIMETFTTLINPGIKIPAKIINITGINNAMVAEAPALPDVIAKIQAFMGTEILAGYNVRFDLGFLYTAWLKYFGKSLRNDYFDAFKTAKRLVPDLPNYKLGTVAEHFGIKADGAHRALADVHMTFEIMQRLQDIKRK